MIRILYIVSTLEAKGPTQQLYYIIKSLDKREFEVMVLTLSSEPENSMYSRFLEIGISLNSLNNSRLQGIFNNLEGIKQTIAAFKPNLIQSMGFRADKYAVNFSSLYSCISTSRNSPLVDYPQKFGKIKGYLIAKMHLHIFRKLNMVSCSFSIAKELKKAGIESKVIQNGVDIKHYTFVLDKISLRKELGLPVYKKIFISTGSLIYRKNMGTLLKAFQRLKSDFLLLIIGDGVERKTLEGNCTDSRVRFLGYKENVRDYLQVSDVFVSASRAEGLPNAVLEALACGLPAILSSIDPHLEIVKGSVFENYMFSPEDSDSLSEKMQEIVSHEYSLDAVNLVRNHFSDEKMAKQYQHLYAGLLNQYER